MLKLSLRAVGEEERIVFIKKEHVHLKHAQIMHEDLSFLLFVLSIHHVLNLSLFFD